MSTIFTMQGNKHKRLYASFAQGPLEITGCFWMQGPQPIGVEGGIPEEIAQLFENKPDLQTVSLEWKSGGRTNAVIYSRMKEEINEQEKLKL